jgi:hypothetical protein
LLCCLLALPCLLFVLLLCACVGAASSRQATALLPCQPTSPAVSRVCLVLLLSCLVALLLLCWSGIIQAGDRVVAMPANQPCNVKGVSCLVIVLSCCSLAAVFEWPHPSRRPRCCRASQPTLQRVLSCCTLVFVVCSYFSAHGVCRSCHTSQPLLHCEVFLLYPFAFLAFSSHRFRLFFLPFSSLTLSLLFILCLFPSHGSGVGAQLAGSWRERLSQPGVQRPDQHNVRCHPEPCILCLS